MIITIIDVLVVILGLTLIAWYVTRSLAKEAQSDSSPKPEPKPEPMYRLDPNTHGSYTLEKMAYPGSECWNMVSVLVPDQKAASEIIDRIEGRKFYFYDNEP